MGAFRGPGTHTTVPIPHFFFAENEVLSDHCFLPSFFAGLGWVGRTALVRTARGIFLRLGLTLGRKKCPKRQICVRSRIPSSSKFFFWKLFVGQRLPVPSTYLSPPLPHSSYAKKRTMYPKICFCLVPNLVSAIKHWRVLFIFSPYSIRLRSKISVEKKFQTHFLLLHAPLTFWKLLKNLKLQVPACTSLIFAA